jgi:ribosomal protein S27AE
MTFRQDDGRPCENCGPAVQFAPLGEALDGHLAAERACPECGSAWLVLSFEAELAELAAAETRPTAAFLAA